MTGMPSHFKIKRASEQPALHVATWLRDVRPPETVKYTDPVNLEHCPAQYEHPGLSPLFPGGAAAEASILVLSQRGSLVCAVYFERALHHHNPAFAVKDPTALPQIQEGGVTDFHTLCYRNQLTTLGTLTDPATV